MLNFSNARVLVIGDIMLDTYWSGSVERISPEGPVPVVKITQQKYKIGGAGNVGLNLNSLKVQSHLIGMIGDDQNGHLVQKELQKNNISNTIVVADNYPTITKLRILGQSQQLIRIDFEKNYHDINKNQIAKKLENNIKNYDILIISDYAKGTLSNISEIISIAKKFKKIILVDPKGDNFTKYKGATLIKPNLKEFELIAGKCNSQEQIISKAKQLITQLNIEYMLITQGSEGMSLISKNGEINFEKAYSKEVYDVTGAGDTVIATLAAALGSGHNIKQAMNFSNIAASCVIQKLGAATITPQEIQKKLSSITPIKFGALNTQSVKLEINKAKSIGKKIVFTNGCFDLIHAGHVSYLKKAKQLGDLLLVAINDDSSIKRIKGDTRPISTLESRIKVLESLECVDWVISFTEDTPKNLLSQIQPDILAKGGDYKSTTEIIGYEIIQAYGGKAIIIDHDFQDYSTTKLIDKITQDNNHKHKHIHALT